MVFSINTLNESINKPFHVETEKENDNFSFFESSLTLLITEQREFEYNMIQLSEGLVSNAVIDKVVNKIKSINIEELLTKIFDWFIEAIKKMHETFSIFLVKLINKDKRIKLYKKKLESFEGTINYNKSYYTYTNLLSDSSYTDYKDEISKVYDDLIDKLSKLGKYNTPMELASILSYIRNDTEYDSKDLDNIRGKILGRNSLISKEDFATELFKYFRNGKENPVELGLLNKKVTFTKYYIKEAYDSYFNYSKQRSIIQRESHKLTAQALAQKTKIRTTNPFKYMEVSNLSTDVITQYNSIISIKCRKIKDICDIYRLYYSAKLDALKEYNCQNINILAAAVNEIIKEEKKNDD